MKLKRDVREILKLADDPGLDPLLKLVEPITSVALATHGSDIERLFYALKEYVPTPEGFDHLYKFDVLAGEVALRALHVGFVCGLLLGSDPLWALKLSE